MLFKFRNRQSISTLLINIYIQVWWTSIFGCWSNFKF